MLAAVEFNDNLLVEGNKVYNICFNRLLSTELDPFKLPVSQMIPKQAFNISGSISQPYGIFLKRMTRFHDGFPHPLSPSRKGRGSKYSNSRGGFIARLTDVAHTNVRG